MNWFTSYLVRPEAKQRTTTGTADLQAAADAYNRDHSRAWGSAGTGTCPICAHHGCFGEARGKLAGTGRWACFSANHGNIGRKLRACFYGDALDVDAYQHNRTRIEHLKATGYLASIAQAREVKRTPTTDTPQTSLGHSGASDLTPYLADFLRERRAVLAYENPAWSIRQVNAEARRLLAAIQEREREARHA
jgi:hypothetical protein